MTGHATTNPTTHQRNDGLNRTGITAAIAIGIIRNSGRSGLSYNRYRILLPHR